MSPTTATSPAGTLPSVLLLLLCLFAMPTHAQTAPACAGNGAGAPAAPAKPSKNPYGRETPEGMVSGLMSALAAADYARAVQYFQTNSVPGQRNWYVLPGQELARQF